MIVGSTVAHYKILEELGSGGMGVVYRARDEELRRDVALKLLPPRVAGDAERLQRFEREARAVAALTHPNIVTIYSIEGADGRRFMTMELVEGQTVDRVTPRGGLDLDRFFDLGIALADAVSAAHEKGIIHRDLKPGNVMVGARGEIKVLDFGLAKLLEPSGAGQPTTESPTEILTQDGQAVGTVTYMSPEQLRGVPADARSDIFSLGVLLYLMVTGRHPFAAAATAEVTSKILRDTPSSVSDLRRDLPRQLGRIISLAMEKDPERRYQSAKDLRNELEALRAELSSSTAVAPPPARHSRLGLVIATALLVVATAWVAWRWWPEAAPPGAPAFLSIARMSSTTTPPAEALAVALPELVLWRLADTRGAYVIAEGADPRSDLLLQIDGRAVGERVRLSYRLRRRDESRELGGAVVEGDRGELIDLIDQIGADVAEVLSEELGRRVEFHPRAVPTRDPQALAVFLQGLAKVHGVRSLAQAEEVRGQFERALGSAPGFALARAFVGLAQLHVHRFLPEGSILERALTECREAARVDSRLAEAYSCSAESLMRLDRPLDAVADYLRAIRLKPTLIEAYEGIRSAHRLLRHSEQAHRNWQQVVDLHPDFWAGHLYLGGFYFREGEYEAAFRSYERALELAPDNASTQVSLGGSLYFLGRWEEAVQALQRSIQVRPTFGGYSNLGSTYFILRRFDEAVDAFERAADFEKADLPTYGNLAKAYYWSGRRTEATETFERAVRMAESRLTAQPGDADAMILSAHYLAMLDDREASLELLAEAMRLRPEDSHYAYLAGLIHSQLGDTDRALDWLERARDEDYSLAEIRNTIELDGLRDEPRFRALLEAG